MEDEAGAGVAGLGLTELIAERCEGLGPAGGGERVEPDEQLAGAGDDVAGAGECFADEGVCLVAGAGVVGRPAPGRARFRCYAAMRMAWVICLTSASRRTMSGAISPRRMRAETAAAASWAAWSSRAACASAGASSLASGCRASACSPVASGDSAAPSTALVPHSPSPTTRTCGNGPWPASLPRVAELGGGLRGAGQVQVHPVDRGQPLPEQTEGRLLLLPVAGDTQPAAGGLLQQPFHHLPDQPLARQGDHRRSRLHAQQHPGPEPPRSVQARDQLVPYLAVPGLE